jgi:hypothetical protein
VLPADYAFTPGDNGAHTFSVTLKTAGTQVVTVTDTANGSVNGSGALAINPAAASHLSLQAPTSISSGTPFTLTVTALDPYNNIALAYAGTIHITSSDTGATLPANYTFNAGDRGVHSFTSAVILQTIGVQTLTATDTSTGSVQGSVGLFVVTAGSGPTHFGLALPSNDTAGTPVTITVTVLDQNNSTVTSYNGTIRFSSSDAQAGLPANYTFTAADKGVHTFTNGVILRTAGNQAVTATDTLVQSLSSSGIVVVSPSAASHFTFNAPAGSTAGAAFTVMVTAWDQYNNVAVGYRGTIKFTSSDGQATLPANYTFSSTDQGVHTFTSALTLKTAGSQAITATDTGNGSLKGTATVSVSPSPAITLSISAPLAVVAGTWFTVTVSARDQYGNIAPGYLGTVHFSSSDALAILPADYTFSGNDQGIHTFTSAVKLRTTGNQSLTATDTSTGSIKGSVLIAVARGGHPGTRAPRGDRSDLDQVALITAAGATSRTPSHFFDGSNLGLLDDFFASDRRITGGVFVGGD